MQIIQKKRAAIYCRVSTKEQVDEGNSLHTQEKLCRDYAIKNGYEIAEVYIEQGESAKTVDRTELKKMLAFCADKKNGVSAVIAYKIDRISRKTDDYSQLRTFLKQHGVEIKSVTELFENNPMGRFMENIMANVAELDNDSRSERCAGGMRDAMREGRYVWMAPIGYDNVRANGKATIAPNLIMAPFMRETFEMIAKNTYSVEEVRRTMAERGLRLKNGKPVSKQYFYDMIKNRLYIGYIEKFGESHKGLFEPVVNEELFNQVQRVLKRRGKKMSQYKLDNEDFPLRRFVVGEDGRKLTGSWSQGRHKKYPFYRFGVKGSNYNREKFENGFMEFMDHYRFNEELFEKLKEKLKVKLGNAVENEKKDISKLKKRIADLEEKQNLLITKNFDGIISDSVLKHQLDIIEKETAEAQINIVGCREMKVDLGELLMFVENYLKNPSTVWKTASFDTRLKLQWFQFPQGITFQNGVYGTAEIASVFKTKEAFLPPLSAVVEMGGIEPPCKIVFLSPDTNIVHLIGLERQTKE